MKKLLFIIYNLNNGGAERSLVNLLNEIDYSQYSVDLQMFANEGMFLSQVPNEVNILEEQRFLGDVYTGCKRSGLHFVLNYSYKVIGTAISHMVERKVSFQKAFRYLKFYDQKCQDLKKIYDVAVAYISGDVLFFTANHVKAKRKIVFVHNDYRSAKHAKKYEEPFFEKFNKIVTISDTCARVLKEEFPQCASKVMYLPNIVSTHMIRKRMCEKQPKEFLGQECLKIVSVGRLNEQKGFDLAIDAVSLLKKKGENVCWLIIGNGELEEELVSKINSLGVEDRIRLIGARENPYVYMKAADVVVQTSRWEGKSVVLDEAKIIGTPIITTNYPTAKDQIKDSDEGLIVDMTPEAIASGIERLMTDCKLREHIHEYLLQHEYGNAREVEEYYKLFMERQI